MNNSGQKSSPPGQTATGESLLQMTPVWNIENDCLDEIDRQVRR